MNNNKPKLPPEKLVKKMKEEKGITFYYKTEKESIDFLKFKNNFYRLASYRKNYYKNDNGKYINLDFAYLIDLSTIDMHLRNIIFKMCLDIEHDLKVQLLNDITSNPDENGYNIVVSFIDNNEFLKEEIYKKRYSTYVGDLINKFFKFKIHKNSNNKDIIDDVEIRCPIWAFVEIISFGTFINLYDYYYDFNAPIQKQLLNPVKSLRNACAHNNCLINDLRKRTTKPTQAITTFISKIPTISRDKRRNNLSIKPVFEFCSLLFVYDNIVSSDIKKHCYDELYKLFFGRITRNKHYYQDNTLLISRYSFISEIIKFLKNQ